MCGIAGQFVFGHGSQVTETEIRQMCKTIAHRGPDDEGYYIRGPVGLGHRRLSVIDVESGKQPIANEDHTVWVMLNGEIYNYLELRETLRRRGHRFRTSTDTEVIAHLYEDCGEAFLLELRGMFALALWDERNQTLLLARDPLGKKPLFYSIVPGRGLVFGSEMKAILQCPQVVRSLNIEALDTYLSLMYVPAPLTIFQGIYKLPAGHLLLCSRGQVVVKEFWDLDCNAMDVRRESDLLEEFEGVLDESVRLRLRSDVPIAAFLSGGLDSSSVVAIMARLLNRPVVTCSVGFREEEYCELSYAREIATRFGCDHHEYVVQPCVEDIVPRIVAHFDEPFGDSSAIPTYYVSRLARQHATVVLSGDGGDEVFAGYSRHYLQMLECRLRDLLLPSSANESIGRLSNYLPDMKGKQILRRIGMRPDLAYAYKHCQIALTDDEKNGLYTNDVRECTKGSDPGARLRDLYNGCSSPDPVNKALYVDLKTYLADDILVKVDRMSMAHGLELRAPLLDRKLIEFVAKLPGNLKLRARTSKYLLRELMKKYLPRHVLTRRKHGFTMPLGQWLTGPLRSMVEECLFGERAKQRGLFNRACVRTLWARQLSGQMDSSHALWMLLILELWHRQYLDVQPQKEASTPDNCPSQSVTSGREVRV